MTGAEHYAEAERLLDGPDVDMDDYDKYRADNLAAAQVHATLALAAATAWGRAQLPVDAEGSQSGYGQ